MKPKKLIMYAFGPYANREEVNFEELGSRTMFVISGKTGAGKTTIFDAIAFALYGKTSGEERSAQDLRSDFAHEDQITSVDFTFSLKSRTYRIVRSPIQTRKKTRGEGFTTVSAKAEIYELMNGEEKLLGATLSESDDQINKLLQLDFHQFKQILMIPQGEFRTLLTSDSTDKEKILQKLFHTESYRYFQDYLKARSKELKEEAAGFLKDRQRLYEAIDPLDQADLTDALNQEQKHDELIISIANDLVATQKEKNSQYNKEIISKKEVYKDMLKKIEHARYIEQTFNELQKTNDELSQLGKNQQEIIRLKNILQHSKDAEFIWPFYADVMTKEKELELRKKQRTETHSRLKMEQQQHKNAKQTLEEQKNRKDQIKKDENELTRLNSLKEKLEQYVNKSKELTQFAESGRAEKTKLDHLKSQLAKNEKLKITLSDALQKRYKQQTRSAELTVELNQLNDLIKVLKDIGQKNTAKERLVNEINDKKNALERVNQQLLTEQKHLDHALNEQSVQHAFELSGQLEEGKACPVCGSTHHPAPAVLEGEIIETENLRKNIEVLQSDKIRTESAIEHLNKRISETDSEITALTAYRAESDYFKEQNSLNDYINLADTFQQEQQSLHAQLNQKDGTDDIKQTDQHIQELQRQIQLLEATVQNKRDEYVSIRSIVNQLKEEIPDQYLNQGELQNRVNDFEKKIQFYHQQYEQAETDFLSSDKELARLTDRLKQAEEEEKKIERSVSDAKSAFDDSLSGSSFENTEELIEAKLEEKEKQEVEQKINAFEKKVFSLNEYADKLKKDLHQMARPDIKKLEAEKEAVEKSLVRLEDQQSTLSSYIRHHDQILLNLKENQTAAGAVEKRYLLTGQLSEIANGQNELKLTFERFVLAYYLEDILLVANERLLKMTSGRYELHRKEDRSKGNKQGGLELLVMDHYTGQQRHVKTLSGGEAFKASLALALGLADVVQSYAGGVSLETMFIDEGFGTLDPESLDQAIESLMDIQSGGRLVGVISHVPELKERIDARLEVFSTKGGSSTRFVFETL